MKKIALVLVPVLLFCFAGCTNNNRDQDQRGQNGCKRCSRCEQR